MIDEASDDTGDDLLGGFLDDDIEDERPDGTVSVKYFAKLDSKMTSVG